MTSGYTRLEAALAHREPDSVPFDLGGQDGLLVSLDMYKRLIWP
jgi:hypothetical protein